MANTPRAGKSWCYRILGPTRVCDSSLGLSSLPCIRVISRSLSDLMLKECSPTPSFTTNKIWLQPNQCSTPNIPCSLATFFRKANQKHSILPCNWPKYPTLYVNFTKCFELLLESSTTSHTQTSESQCLPKEGLWVNLTNPCHLINGWDLCSVEQILLPIWYLQYLKNISSLLPVVGAQRGLQGWDSADFTPVALGLMRWWGIHCFVFRPQTFSDSKAS